MRSGASLPQWLMHACFPGLASCSRRREVSQAVRANYIPKELLQEDSQAPCLPRALISCYAPPHLPIMPFIRSLLDSN